MYLDPSFGGMFVQIVIAVAATAGALLFGLRRKIAKLFRKNKMQSAKKADAVPADEVVDMLAETDQKNL
ncbi:MAG: hypothetical protein LBQ15_01645 [Clostridium sp.]|jgi:hypothetical protein|nr:hypothetical protein [Clostridium sp.]